MRTTRPARLAIIAAAVLVLGVRHPWLRRRRGRPDLVRPVGQARLRPRRG